MNDLVPLDGTVVSKGSTGIVRVVALEHPFSQDTIYCEAPLGLTIRQIIGCDRSDLFVMLNGELLESNRWDSIIPCDNDLLNIVPIPGDGGDVKRLIGTIGLIALAVWAAPLIPGLLGISSGIMSTAAFWQAGIFAIGSLILNSLIPPPTLEQPESTRTQHQISGSSNRIAQYEPVPIIYGRHKTYPPYAALPYTENVANDQYLHMLFCVGVGDYELSDIKVGDTPLLEYSGVDVEQTMTPDGIDILEESLNLSIADPSDPLGGISTFTRTTAEGVTFISVDLVLPAGIQYVGNHADRRPVSIDFRLEYREVGSGTWLNVKVDNTDWPIHTDGSNEVLAVQGEDPPDLPEHGVLRLVALVGWSSVSAEDFRLYGNTRNPQRITIKWSVPSGEYDVRITRTLMTQPDGDFDGSESELAKYSQSLIWSALRSFNSDVNVVNTEVHNVITFLKVRIRASDQLNGVLDRLNLIAYRKLRSWDGDDFVAPATTRSPAWAFLDILTGLGNFRAISDAAVESLVELDTLLEWDGECLESENESYYDDVISDPSSVFEILRRACAVGRGAVNIRDGKFTVVRETSSTVPVQHFTPRNTSDFSSIKNFIDIPHALRVRFISDQVGYIEDEVIVYDDGYNSSNAEKFEVLELIGVTDYEQAWRMGRYHLAVLRLRPEIFTFSIDIEHLVAQKGDYCKLSHDVALIGLGSARIKSISGNDITLDDAFDLAGSGTYAIRVRTNDGGTVVQNITQNTGYLDTFTFNPSIPAGVNVGDLCMLGLSGIESINVKITRIVPEDANHKASISCVDAAPGVLTAHSGTIPAYDPFITMPVDQTSVVPPTARIVSIRSDVNSQILDNNGQPSARVLISFAVTSQVFTAYQVQIRFRETDLTESTGQWKLTPLTDTTNSYIVITDVEAGESYEFQIRVISSHGVSSDWSSSTLATVYSTPRIPAAAILNIVSGDTALYMDVVVSNIELFGITGIEYHWSFVNNRDAGTITVPHGVPAFVFNAATSVQFRSTVAISDNIPRYWWARFKAGDVDGDWFPASATAGIRTGTQVIEADLEEYFSNYYTESDLIERYTEIVAGEYTFPETGIIGGKVLQAVGETHLVGGRCVEFDPNELYEAVIVIEQTNDPSTGGSAVDFGIECVAADLYTKVNTSGANSSDDQHFFALSNVTRTESHGLTTHRGYLHGNLAYQSNAISAFRPSGVHADTRYIRLAMRMNRTAGDGTIRVDQFTLRRVDPNSIPSLAENLLGADELLLTADNTNAGFKEFVGYEFTSPMPLDTLGLSEGDYVSISAELKTLSDADSAGIYLVFLGGPGAGGDFSGGRQPGDRQPGGRQPITRQPGNLVTEEVDLVGIAGYILGDITGASAWSFERLEEIPVPSGATHIFLALYTNSPAGSDTLQARKFKLNRGALATQFLLSPVGEPGEDGLIFNYIFRRTNGVPATPTGNNVPAGWSNSPPAYNGDALWTSVARQDSEGTTQGLWSTPIKLDGSTWYSGSDAPASELGQVGDFYLDENDGDVYEKVSEFLWVLRTSIQGPAGAQGIPGQPGRNTLNINPTFSDALGNPSSYGWSSGTAVTLLDGRAGRNALRINTSSYVELRSENIAIDRTKSYIVSVFARQLSPGQIHFLMVDFYDALGNYIDGSSGGAGWTGIGSYFYWDIVGASFTSEFVKYSITFGEGAEATIPAGAVSCRIGCLINYTSVAASFVEFQDFKLERIVNLTEDILGQLQESFAAAGLRNLNISVNADGSLVGAGGGAPVISSLTGFITTGQLTANILAALQAVVGNLSAIRAELGTCLISDTGHLRSGQTDYDNGTGWFLGHNGSNPVMSIGNSAGNKVTWDGTTLAVIGNVDIAQAETSFTVNWLSGWSVAPSGNFYYRRSGNLVWIRCDASVFGTSNSGNFSFDSWPVAIRPSAQRQMIVSVYNGGTLQPGTLTINSDGTCGVVPYTGAGGTFSGSGNKGFTPGSVFGYTI